MKKTILILLAILLVATMTTALVACEQDPCEIKGHIWDEGSVTLEPTCQTEGKLLRRCLVCGETVEEPTAKVDHVWGEPTVTVPATCSTDGQGTVKCQNCTETHGYTIPATGNHVVNLQAKHEAVEATCWREGTVEYYDCQTCGDKVKLDVYGNVLDEEALSVAKTAHNYDNGVITKSPTCSDTGIKIFTCQNEGCTGDGHTFKQVLDKIEHVFGRLIPAQDATCTEAGHIAYYQCSECHAFFDERKTPIDESQLAVKELGHKEKTLSAEQATCQHTGLTEGKVCERCGEVLQQQQKTDKLPHKPEPYGAVAPTCEATGYSAGSRCSECGTIIIYPKTLAALGHSYKLTQWNWTDANTKATAEFRCDNANCPHPVVTVEAQVTGEDVLDYKVFTATAQGPDGKIYTETKQVGEHEHSYVLKNWTWAPDYSKATAHFNCPVCEDDPHDVEVTPTSERTESTCTVAGKITYTATADYNGVTATDARTVELQLAEHKFGAKLEYDADHPENGHGYRCETCKQIITYVGHVLTDKHSTTQHWQACECGYTTEKFPHNFTYQGADGKATHTKVCPDCKYSITENCTVGDDGICTFCQTNDGKEALIVHFHKPSDWTGTLHLHVWNNSNSNLAGSWPGAKGFEAEPGFTGWYVIRFRMATSNFNSSLQIIVNDGSNQTGNISVPTTTKEIYVPAITGGTEAFTDREAALAKESNSPDDSYYFITGSFNGTTLYSPNTGDWDRVFTEKSSWTLESDYKQGDTFRIRQNVSNWNAANSNFHFGNMTITGATEGVDYTGLLTDGGGSDRNITVNRKCHLKITFDPANKQIKIFVVSADKPSGTGKSYILAGVVNGVEDWSNSSTKHPLTYNSDGTYSITVTFKQFDSFKIWEKGTYDALVDGGCKFTYTFANGLEKVNDLFTGSANGNVGVSYDCTVTLKVTSTNNVSVTVTSLTVKEKVVDYYVRGGMNNWLNGSSGAFAPQDKYKFTKNEDGTYTLSNLYFSSSSTEFKIYATNNAWYGGSYSDNPISVKADSGITVTVKNTDNLKISPAGYYDFTWNPTTKQLTVAKHVDTPTHTHAYVLDTSKGTDGWTWATDHSTATAHFKCTGEGTCSEPTKDVKATITPNTTPATCTTAGSTTYTATVTGPDNNSYTDKTDSVAIPALGHKYTGEWTWSEEGGISAKLVLTCSQCEDGDGHTVTFGGEQVVLTSEVTKQPDLFTTGTREYTATVTQPEDSNNYEDVVFSDKHQITLVNEGNFANDFAQTREQQSHWQVGYSEFDFDANTFTFHQVTNVVGDAIKNDGSGTYIEVKGDWMANGGMVTFAYTFTQGCYVNVHFTTTCNADGTAAVRWALQDGEGANKQAPEYVAKAATVTLDKQITVEAGDVLYIFVNHEIGGSDQSTFELTLTASDVCAHSYKVDETKGDKVKGLVWNDDYSFATLYLVCEHDAAHTLKYTFDSTTTNGGDCTSASTTTYTVEVTQEAVQAKVTAENEGGTVTMDTLTLTYVDETADISGHNWTLQNVVWGGYPRLRNLPSLSSATTKFTTDLTAAQPSRSRSR